MKKGFTLIELLAVIIVLAIVTLIATPIVLNVIEDSKKSAAESEANLVLSGLTTYCQTEDSKVQMGTLDGDRKCSDNMSEGVIKELVPNISSTTKIEDVEYKNGKIISLKVESNGHKFELNNGIMSETQQVTAYYAFGMPTTESSINYQDVITESGSNVFVKLEEEQLSLCIYGNDGLECFKNGNYDEESVHLQNVFGADSCTSEDSRIDCSNDRFLCIAALDGGVNCYQGADFYCYVDADGSAGCS